MKLTHTDEKSEGLAALELRGVSCKFPDHLAVNDVSLAIRRGEFLTLLGPSGCGKTTILRMVAGFENPTSGQILIGGQPMAGVPAYRRPVGIVFQNLALFPHMTVAENIAFGLEVQKTPRSEIDRRVADALDLIGLSNLGRRRIHEVSGGQRQRVALARALVLDPQVLLLDEPLGALDLKIRRQLQIELKRIQKQVGTTFVFVTHDQEEALTMSDRIAVMNGGKIEQLGTASDIYDAPSTAFVANFIGETNFFSGVAKAPASGSGVNIHIGKLGIDVPVTGMTSRPAEGTEISVSVRPENIAIFAEHDGRVPFAAEGTISSAVYAGTSTRYVIDANGTEILATLPSSPSQKAPFLPGERVKFGWLPDNALAKSVEGWRVG